MGEIIVSGDLNARTGDKHDFVFEEDTQNRYDVPLPDFYIYDKSITRNNRDNTCNAYGKCLIEICRNCSLRIMNGCIVGDSFGSFTYYKNNNKKSCVDYTISTTTFMKQFQYFSISPPDMELSDHCIQKFGVKCEVNGKTGIKVKESKSKKYMIHSSGQIMVINVMILPCWIVGCKMCTFLTINF